MNAFARMVAATPIQGPTKVEFPERGGVEIHFADGGMARFDAAEITQGAVEMLPPPLGFGEIDGYTITSAGLDDAGYPALPEGVWMPSARKAMDDLTVGFRGAEVLVIEGLDLGSLDDEDPRDELMAALHIAADAGMTKPQMQEAIAQFFSEHFPEVVSPDMFSRGVVTWMGDKRAVLLGDPVCRYTPDEPIRAAGVKPSIPSLTEVQDGSRYRGMGFNGE